MLKTFITAFILTSAPISSFKIASDTMDAKQTFKVDKLDEADLSVDTYEPGDSSMSKWYSIKRVIDKDGIFSVVVKIDPEGVFKIIDEAAQSAGLLTGQTPYELWRKDNKIVIDYANYKSSTEIKIFDKLTQKWITQKVGDSKPDWSTYWTSQNPEFRITPRGNIEKMIIHPNGNLSELNFANKDYLTEFWGSLYSSRTNNIVDFSDIFREPDVDKEDETFNNAMGNFYTEIIRISNDDFVPSSDYYNVIIANQNSVKFQYKKGPNIVIQNENKNREIPISPYWLLFPSLLVIVPYSYFAIKRITKR